MCVRAWCVCSMCSVRVCVCVVWSIKAALIEANKVPKALTQISYVFLLLCVYKLHNVSEPACII